MTRLIAFCAVSVCCCMAMAQEDPRPEIIRRGDHAESLGLTQAGPDAAQLNALAPPEDDSDRWFINVITTKESPWAADCAKLANDFATSAELRAWGDVDDPSKSWAHLDFKDVGDPKLKDWFAGLRSQLDGRPFPAVHLQPPRNGAFGKNEITVGIIHGYNGDPKALSDRIRAQIKRYADTVGLVQSTKAGHGQHAANPPSRNPIEWPPQASPLTYKRVKELCPRAPYQWITAIVKANLASEDELLQAYDEFLAGEQAEDDEVKVDTPNPTEVRISSLEVLVLIAFGIGIVIVIYRDHKRRTSSNSNSTNAGSITTG